MRHGTTLQVGHIGCIGGGHGDYGCSPGRQAARGIMVRPEGDVKVKTEPQIPEVIAEEGMLAHFIDLVPCFIGWGISFGCICMLWHEQHLVFAHLRACDVRYMPVSLGQLACISRISFATELLGDFAMHREGRDRRLRLRACRPCGDGGCRPRRARHGP